MHDSTEEHLAYWRTKLAGAPDLIDLPLDHPRSAAQTFAAHAHTVSLPTQLAGNMRGQAKQAGVDPLVIALTAWQMTLARYSGQADSIIGLTLPCRMTESRDGLIGPFANTLPIRVDFADAASARAAVHRVAACVDEASHHQDLPFARLLEAYQRRGDLSHAPLVQATFAWQVMAEPCAALDLAMRPFHIAPTMSPFDLTLTIVEDDEALSAEILYNAAIFLPATIERIARHWQCLLEGLVTDPDRAVADLPLLDADELDLMLRRWNDTEADFPADCCLHQLFEAQADRRPDAPAVISGDRHLTYREIDEHANWLAHRLQGMGVGPETCVGLCVERSVEMVIGMLGIMKAGGAYVPLDPAYPPERLRFMLDDTQAQIGVAQAHLQATLPSFTGAIVTLERDDWGREATRPAARVTPMNLAYVIFTSGSTGQPKGVAVPHRGVVNNLTDINRRFAVGDTDRVLNLSSPSFDMCVYEVLGIFAAGGAVVIPALARRHDPGHWTDLIHQHHVTIWNSAPTLLEMFVGAVSARPDAAPRHLRLALLGGDWVPIDLPDRLKAIVPQITVVSLGGATEASIHSIVYPTPDQLPGWRSIPYGKPMANQQAYVLDAHWQPVPIGVAGELYLSGTGVGRGYFNRPALTAGRFLPNPFDGRAGSRMYRTGDLARYHDDGTIELLGRIDYQVKIRGFRIELGEIETALKEHAAVHDAVVLARTFASGDKRLVAYIVPDAAHCGTSPPAPAYANHDLYAVPALGQGTSVAAEPAVSEDEPASSRVSPQIHDDLRRHLEQRLPGYMLPAAFVWLAALPLSPNGKIDRNALPVPHSAREISTRGFLAPRTPVEAFLADIWAELLAIDEIGAFDHFFDLGGHSLLATQAIARIYDVLQVDLSLREFFAAPVLADLAAALELRGRVGNRDVARIAQIYREVSRLTDEEVDAMLVTKGITGER